MKTRNAILLLTASVAVFIEALDIAIINLAIPLIRTSFGVPYDKAQWLQAFYILIYGGFLLLGGKLSDAYGRRTVFLFGAAVFGITSLGAGLSPDFESLLIFRAVQGFAAALLMPSALSIITTAFTESSERSKAIGVFSSFAAIGSGSGLSVGGLLATAFGWQWVFLLNVPLIGIVWWLGYTYFPEDHKVQNKSNPDLLSAVLITTGIFLASYIVHELSGFREHFVLLITLTIVAGACLRAFILRNRRLSDPLINLSLFRNRSTIVGNGLSTLLGAVFSGYLFIISIVMQNNMHYSAAKAGLTLFPFSVISALVAKFILPKMLQRLSVHQTAAVGMSLLVAGSTALFGAMHFNYQIGFLLLSALFITGSGIAVVFPCLMILSVREIPTADHGVATSLVATCYFLGGGLGLSVLSLFMQASEDYITYTPVIVLGSYAAAGLAVLVVATAHRRIRAIS